MKEAFDLLTAYGIKVVRSEKVGSVEEGKIIAEKIGFPLVLKISTKQPIHKTELGLVKLNVEKENFESSFNDILMAAKKAGVSYDGVFVQEMAKPGLEVITGIKTDPQFGKIILFGLGGIYTEIIRDFSIRISPISEVDAREMIEELRSKEIFTARGRTYNINAIVKLLLSLNEIAQNENINELDLNPIIIYPQGSENDYLVVDVRIVR